MPYPYKGNRGQAVNYIPELINEGLTNSQIIDFLRLNDLGYTTAYMRQDINRFRLEQLGADQIRGLGADDIVPDRFMREWFGETKYKYRVVVEYSYFDTNTLNTEKGYTTLYYKDAPTQNEVLGDFGVRRQTIENTYGMVQEVFSETQIHYYRNVK